MEDEVKALVRQELARYNDGFETRLTLAIQRALDTVLSSLEDRIRTLEEDVARLSSRAR